jgi:WhiB family transcriptional regulator, redox-sensing transcriptional regulator
MSKNKTAHDVAWAVRVLENPPAARDPEWATRGACGPVYASTGQDWWFGPDEDDPGFTGTLIPAEDSAKARRVCRGCPVRAECFLYAWERPEEYGIWGSFTPYQRTWLRRRLNAAKAA